MAHQETKREGRRGSGSAGACVVLAGSRAPHRGPRSSRASRPRLTSVERLESAVPGARAGPGGAEDGHLDARVRQSPGVCEPHPSTRSAVHDPVGPVAARALVPHPGRRARTGGLFEAEAHELDVPVGPPGSLATQHSEPEREAQRPEHRRPPQRVLPNTAHAQTIQDPATARVLRRVRGASCPAGTARGRRWRCPPRTRPARAPAAGARRPCSRR